MQAGGDIPSYRPRPQDCEEVIGLDDFSPQALVKRSLPSKLEPYKANIDKWLADDEGTWRKQWHTAQRIHDRLAQEVPGYDCSYSTVQRYVKERRRAAGERAYLELTWHPGESQVFFVK